MSWPAYLELHEKGEMERRAKAAERLLEACRVCPREFLAHCNLCCVFCQNAEISQEGEGQVVSTKKLAEMMLELQRLGCHNINFVTPTHQVPQILQALPLAVEGGLEIPLVYNCGGYESLETLRMLDGVFDIYMPDFKYADADVAKRYSKAENYPEVARAALREMHR